MGNILLINGPNLNLLGGREPVHYGAVTLNELCKMLEDQARDQGHSLTCIQTQFEGEMIEAIQKAADTQDVILINPGALAHTSIALRDALIAADIYFLEIHISNIYDREPFRHHSYLRDIACGQIVGLGPMGYNLGLLWACHVIDAEHMSQEEEGVRTWN